MTSSLTTAFLCGCGCGLLGLVPAAVVAVLCCRYCLRLATRAEVEATEWRSAAANATVLARTLESRLPPDDLDEDDYNGG